jgi:hypothetical protein
MGHGERARDRRWYDSELTTAHCFTALGVLTNDSRTEIVWTPCPDSHPGRLPAQMAMTCTVSIRRLFGVQYRKTLI